jgi:uncharacterized protein (DUF1778 family)
METVYIGARVETGIKDLVEKVSKLRGEDISDFIRRSVLKELASLSYLPDEDKKALGVLASV